MQWPLMDVFGLLCEQFVQLLDAQVPDTQERTTTQLEILSK